MATTDPNAIAPPNDPLQTTNPPGISGGLIQTNLGAVTPPTNTTATPPLQPVAPVTGYTAATGQAGTAVGTGYQATPYTVAPEGLVQNQVKNIVAEDSPLMQQARVNAAQQMNARGLLNSSLNTQAGQQAVIAQALPIATADAAAQNAAMTNTANAQNTASQFGAAAVNSASSVNAQLLTTMNQANANSQNAALNEQATAANTRALSVLDNNSKQSLAVLQAQNQQLLQSNTNASSMFSQTVNNLAQIAQNPNLDANAKLLATQSQLNLLNEGLRTTGAIATTNQQAISSLNLSQFFQGGTSAYTPAQLTTQLSSLQSAVAAAQSAVPIWGQNMGEYTAPPGPQQSERTSANFLALYSQRKQALTDAQNALNSFTTQYPNVGASTPTAAPAAPAATSAPVAAPVVAPAAAPAVPTPVRVWNNELRQYVYQ